MNFLTNKPVTFTGLLAVFEGIDGSGKSTVAKKIVEYLLQKEICATYLFEPTKEGYGATIRNRMVYDLDSFSVGEQASLFVLNRSDNKEKYLEPYLKQHKVICLDRYYYSSIAYQAATGEVDPQLIYDFNKPVILNPDIVIMFDVEVDTALYRINSNRESSTDYEKKDFLEKAQNIYRSMEAPNIQTVNANASLEEVYVVVKNWINFALDRKNIMLKQFNAGMKYLAELDKKPTQEILDALWERIYRNAYGIVKG